MGNGTPINPIYLTRYFTNLCKKMDIEMTFHGMRHVHATLLLEQNINVKVIQERLGHGDTSTTLQTSSHLTKKMEDEAANKFDDMFK